MNIKGRFTLIAIVLGIAMTLVWPNLAPRTIRVFFKPTLTQEQIDKASKNLEQYINQNYPERYSYKRFEGVPPVDKKNKDAKPEKSQVYYEVYGSFVQAAFLNELSSLEGVESKKVELVPMYIEEKFKARPFKLGLDLQGGMNLVLQADFEKLEQQLKLRYDDKFFEDLDQQIEAETDPEKKESLQFRKQQLQESLVFDEAKRRKDTEGAMEIIRSRIDKTGVSEPLIRMQGEDTIEVSLPGVASPERAKQIIASTARVEYHLGEPVEFQGRYTGAANARFQEFAALETEAEKRMFLNQLAEEIELPSEYGIYVNYDKARIDESTAMKLVPTGFMILEKEVALSGEDISRNVYANFNPEQMQHTVDFELTGEGAKKFADITSNNQGRQLAILIDDKIRSAPRINEPITGGRAQISGSFTAKEAADLALIMKEGALPVPIKIVEERSIGPSLGQESIEKGVEAIFIGLIGVAIFMIFYYHLGGLVAVIALAVNLVLMASVFALMDFTVTLPGLAGVVLTMGMAVDANVIIYEWVREEIFAGKSVKLSIALGFERATWTILDSNLTTMVAAIVLASRLGVGPIKGFGVTLFVGILTSLFTSLYISKTLFHWLAYSVNLKKIPLGWVKLSMLGTAEAAAKKGE